jgi:hypothetical protein
MENLFGEHTALSVNSHSGIESLVKRIILLFDSQYAVRRVSVETSLKLNIEDSNVVELLLPSPTALRLPIRREMKLH